MQLAFDLWRWIIFVLWIIPYKCLILDFLLFPILLSIWALCPAISQHVQGMQTNITVS